MLSKPIILVFSDNFNIRLKPINPQDPVTKIVFFLLIKLIINTLHY